jgi:hypothetical protein
MPVRYGLEQAGDGILYVTILTSQEKGLHIYFIVWDQVSRIV